MRFAVCAGVVHGEGVGGGKLGAKARIAQVMGDEVR
jgi:hypothetical protein